jgi:hypothetical protein
MSLNQQFIDRGFTPIDPTGKGDYELRDDSDGRGVYVSKWQSDQDCPFPELLREPEGKKREKTFRSTHPAKSHLRADWRERRLPNELQKHPLAPVAPVAPVPIKPPTPDPRDAELAALRERVAELETIPEPTPDPEPEHHFADLMLADETVDDAKARLSHRLKELRHYLMAPEIRVNEDGSLGLTPAEQAELQDLERRQTLGRWLEA